MDTARRPTADRGALPATVVRAPLQAMGAVPIVHRVMVGAATRRVAEVVTMAEAAVAGTRVVEAEVAIRAEVGIPAVVTADGKLL